MAYKSYNDDDLLNDYLELDVIDHAAQPADSIQHNARAVAPACLRLKRWLCRRCSWTLLSLSLLLGVGAALLAYRLLSLLGSANIDQVDQMYGKINFVMAKSAATMINYHASLILLTAMPRLCSRMIERSYSQNYRARWRITRWTIDWLNDWHLRRSFFHRYLYYQILFWAVAHSIAHLCNLVRFQASPYSSDRQISLLARFFTFPTPLTGLLLLLSLVWISVCAFVQRFRPALYELFYVGHLVGAMLLFALLLFHGSFCYLPIPQFDTSGASFTTCTPWTSWMWLLPSLVLYLGLERCWRAYESLYLYKVVCRNVIEHPSRILEVILSVQGLKAIGIGQHILLNFKPISRFQWHPFTVTKSSVLSDRELVLSVHIRVVGNWTCSLWSYFQGLERDSEKESGFRIDGPFSSSLSSIPKYPTLLLIGGGIGQTPFTSVLWSLMLSTLSSCSDARAGESGHIYYVGIFRGPRSIEWFHRLLLKLDAIESLRQRLTTRIFLTGTLSDVERNTLLLEAGDHGGQTRPSQDSSKVILDRVLFGRPNLNLLFSEIRQQAAPRSEMTSTPFTRRVGVYYCGPLSLGRKIQALCEAQTLGEEANACLRSFLVEPVSFEFHQELFH